MSQEHFRGHRGHSHRGHRKGNYRGNGGRHGGGFAGPQGRGQGVLGEVPDGFSRGGSGGFAGSQGGGFGGQGVPGAVPDGFSRGGSGGFAGSQGGGFWGQGLQGAVPDVRRGSGGFHSNRFQSSESGNRRGDFRQERRGGRFNRDDNRQQRPGSGERERPPPELKGREIGMWYARRSNAKKAVEQKKNISSVTMDKNKEKNIRDLLNNLKQEDEGGGQSRPSSSSYQGRSGLRPDARNPEFKHPGRFEGKKESFYKPEIQTKFVYQDNEGESDVKQEPIDSWEELSVSDSDQDQDSSMQGATASDERVTTEGDVIDLDDSDDDNDIVPSVKGVMEYMSAHGDYPYQASVDTAFEPLIKQGNPSLDKEMLQKMESLEDNSNYRKMREFRQKLPSYEMRNTIIDTVKGSQVVVISGETGCGKTTQVPQFILDDYINRGVGSQCSIICTQPRRISAISVAERVAAERCEHVDATGHNSIGYQIRLETKRPRTQGSILFCTTGIVLKFLEGDSNLERATHVIIDEIHERDLQSDFLMIILKDLLPKRPDLKVILMSATLNAEMFSRYFNNCPMLNIPGYTFPVKEYLLEEILEMTNFTMETSGNQGHRRPRGKRRKPEEIEMDEGYQVWCRNQVGEYSPRTLRMLTDFDFTTINLDLMMHIVHHIVTKMDDGAILIFVPGWEEIKKLNEMIQRNMRSHSGLLRVIPLHSLMPTVNQREVFERPPPGVRKIVIATNIAETSITIDDVVYVIDCGKIKVKGFQPEMNLTSLEAQWVSKANAKQRRGRAGRVQAGHCFHLYTEFHYQMAQDYLPPEMLRTRLEELCLQIKLLKLGRIVPFISKAMQHPSMEAIQHAIETLTELNALDSDENLLPLGYHLARMPVEPHTAKMILFAAMFGCLDPILTVAASLSFKDAFVIPLGKEEMADRARRVLAKGAKSDHIMLINAFEGWEHSLSRGTNRDYAWRNFLSENTLKLLKDMKRQLAELLYDTGFTESKHPKDPKSNINSHNQSMLRAIICAGLYPNVSQIVRVPRGKLAKNKSVSMVLKDDTKVKTHPKSVNDQETFFQSKWMVFYTKLKTSKIYIHDSSMVSPYPLLFFGGKINIKNNQGQEVVTVDDWMVFRASHSTAKLVKDLRAQLDIVLTEKITRPGPISWDPRDKEGAIMTAIADLITTEQVGCGNEFDGSIGNPGNN